MANEYEEMEAAREALLAAEAQLVPYADRVKAANRALLATIKANKPKTGWPRDPTGAVDWPLVWRLAGKSNDERSNAIKAFEEKRREVGFQELALRYFAAIQAFQRAEPGRQHVERKFPGRPTV